MCERLRRRRSCPGDLLRCSPACQLTCGMDSGAHVGARPGAETEELWRR